MVMLIVYILQLNAFTGEHYVANKTTVVGLGEVIGGGASN